MSNPWEPMLRAFPGYEAPPTVGEAAEGDTPADRATLLGLRRVNADGSVTLFLRSPTDVMYHVMSTLQREEYDLLYEQVIAGRAKLEYTRRGRDPREAVEFLRRRKQDVAALFASFPMGDQTPGVHLESIGRNAFRLRAPVAMREELRLHVFDVVIEGGQFRLLLIR